MEKRFTGKQAGLFVILFLLIIFFSGIQPFWIEYPEEEKRFAIHFSGFSNELLYYLSENFFGSPDDDCDAEYGGCMDDCGEFNTDCHADCAQILLDCREENDDDDDEPPEIPELDPSGQILQCEVQKTLCEVDCRFNGKDDMANCLNKCSVNYNCCFQRALTEDDESACRSCGGVWCGSFSSCGPQFPEGAGQNLYGEIYGCCSPGSLCGPITLPWGYDPNNPGIPDTDPPEGGGGFWGLCWGGRMPTDPSFLWNPPSEEGVLLQPGGGGGVPGGPGGVIIPPITTHPLGSGKSGERIWYNGQWWCWFGYGFTF